MSSPTIVSPVIPSSSPGSESHFSPLLTAESYTRCVRVFSLLFALIALVMLAMFLIYVIRGPVDPLIAAGLFVSFLACLVPALYLLRPFEPPEDLRRRREEERRKRSTGGDPHRGQGS